MFVYKIQDNITKKFDTGARYGAFVKDGKAWTTEKMIKKHLSLFSEKELDVRFKNCSIVKYSLVESEKTLIV